MISLIFATNNHHKIEELQTSIGNNIEIIGLKKAGIYMDIPEPYQTLEENATEKSTTIYKLTGLSCFSEDTGLEITSLGGAPGVKSARYAGEERSFEKNINKILEELADKKSRDARFRTVISLIWEKEEFQFEGICKGQIITEKKGSLGFGYDPVFVPQGSTKTFAEMSMEEKNQFSHRKKAADRLVLFLQERITTISHTNKGE